jgi:polyisoprenoid-binding protein YceI
MILRRLRLAAAASVVFGTAPVFAEPPAWTVDPAASRLAFEARQGAQAIRGRFARWNAAIRFDPADLAGSTVTVEVDPTSLESGDANRDKQAQAAEFFDTARHPVARYRTRSFHPLGEDRFEVEAELTLKGVTRPLRHPVRIRVEGDRASASGEVSLKRRDFGFGSGVFESDQILGSEILVRFTVEAHRS